MKQEGVNNTCNCNVTAYSGVYDNWNTEGKDRKSTPQTLSMYLKQNLQMGSAPLALDRIR